MRKAKNFSVAGLMALLLSVIPAWAQKPVITHNDYDGWKNVSRAFVPSGGEWMYYFISEQQGDAVLHIAKASGSPSYEIPRAYDPKFSADASKVVFKIRPTYAETHEAKVKKKKPDQMPHDTLAVMDLGTGEIEKIPGLKALTVPFSLVEIVAYSKQFEKKDSLLKAGDQIVLNIKTMERDTLRSASNLKFSPKGDRFTFTVKPEAKDSVRRAGLCLYGAAGVDSLFLIDKKASVGNVYWNETGERFAFFANPDTSKAAKGKNDIYLWDGSVVRKILGKEDPSIKEGWKISDVRGIGYRSSDRVLTFGLCPIPPEKDTSYADFERPKLDIWVWNAEYIPPIHKMRAKAESNRSYLSTIDLESGKVLQLADEDVPEMRIGVDCIASKIVAGTDKPYRMQQQWDMNPCSDYYLVNLEDGSRTLLAEAAPWTRFSESPDGLKGVVYDAVKRAWLMVDIESGEITDLTSNLGVDFHDVLDDHPSFPPPTSGATWFKDSRHVAIRDRYDYWVFDLSGAKAPYMLTEGRGRADSTAYNINNPLDSPDYFGRGFRIDPSCPLYFVTQNYGSKEWGVAVKDLSKRRPVLKTLAEGPCKYDGLALSKAVKKQPQRIFFTREAFETGRDIWSTADQFKTEVRLTEVGRQIEKYNWGTVELMKWQRSDGIDAEALLFKPEDFDSEKKYPVIFYFYEKNSQTLYDARNPAPSRSVVNIPYFVSNGYVVCVPDMYYKMDGHPGRDGLESVLSAADQVCLNPWADEKHMGIQGQSWGGYQTAYIVTQTDRFAAAGAGAPVSNMTSAYGGIRWGSGMARTFQYEQQQSRIGKDLWSGYELYYDNSPLFFVPNVTTPVLIMHNDADGAVPWYQGIEFFNALRRCGKPAWMLQYNGEAHNLNARHNAKDLSIRLQQFFDVYLKGAPMPEWMEKGVPATMKTVTLGY